MSIAAEELALLRSQTTDFIAADFKDITLARLTRTANGSGGFTSAYTPLVFPQRMRLIPQAGAGTNRQTLDGEAATPEYVLLAPYDANILRWDTFTDQGRRYQVLFVHEKVSYERKAEVKYLG